MAQRKPIVMNGEVIDVPAHAVVADVVPRDVISVVTHGGDLIPRDRFAQVPVPAGFETNLAAINKGGIAPLRTRGQPH